MRKAAAKTSPAPVGSTAVVGKASIRRQTPRWQSSAPRSARGNASASTRALQPPAAAEACPNGVVGRALAGEEGDGAGLDQPLRLPALRRHGPDAVVRVY